jgi:dolichyl-phosphate-mannose-protein mannosyltransferase
MTDNPDCLINHKPAINRNDWLIAIGLAIFIFISLFAELHKPGVTWDEGDIQFPTVKKQAQWISGLSTIDKPFSKSTIAEYWETTSDHPSMTRTLVAVSYLIFTPWVDEIVSFRLLSALLFSILLASIYLFLRLFLPRTASFAGALSLAMMPRVFGHAHLCSLDAPIMCVWFWAAMAGFLAFHGRIRTYWFGIAYALAFSVKLHAVFLPPALLAWAGLMIICLYRRELIYLKRTAWSTLWAVILTPVIYIATQPWLWHDTWTRLHERFFDYAAKSPIPLLYLGELCYQSNPWHYPLVMILFTVPAFIIFLAAMGMLSPFYEKSSKAHTDNETDSPKLTGIHLFLIILCITIPAIFVLSLAKAYDGCRLFLPCFPFLACLAGFGYSFVWRVLKKRMPGQWLHVVLLALLICPSLIQYYKIRPFYLAYYNEIAGGIHGAWDKGMETTFWCDSLTRDFLEEVNQFVPEGKTIKPASMSFGVYNYYKERGWIKHDIDDPADYYLLQSRQGMFRRDEALMYIKSKTLLSIEIDGVQLYGLYKRSP